MPKLQMSNPRVSIAVEQAVARAMQLHKGHRCASASEFKNALNIGMTSMSTPISSPVLAKPASPRTMWLGFALCLIGVLMLASSLGIDAGYIYAAGLIAAGGFLIYKYFPNQ